MEGASTEMMIVMQETAATEDVDRILGLLEDAGAKGRVSTSDVVTVIGVVAVIVLLTFALPALMGLFAEYGAELPWTTQLLLSIAHWAQDYWVYGLGIVAVIVLAGLWYALGPGGRRRRDHLIVRIPVAGKAAIESGIATLSSTMATLLFAGIPLTEAVDMTIDATQNTVMRDALAEVRTSLLMGNQLSVALSEQRVFPRLFAQMVAVGEETGTLERNLESLASFCEQETNKALSAMTGVIGPALIIVMGLGVGFIAVSIMSAMYGLIQQVG